MEEFNFKKTFSFSEQIAIFLYYYSTPRKHYETYITTQILKDIDYVYEFHQMTFEFLVERHENLRAFFKENEDKSIERLYKLDYKPHAQPLIAIDEEAIPENLDKIFFENFNNDYSIEKLPGIKVLLVKAKNGLFSIIRGHHCYLEIETAKILHRDGLHIYQKIYENKGKITFEEAVIDLPPLPKYSELVYQIDKYIKEKTPLIFDFMKNLTKNYLKGDRGNEPVFGTNYYYNKFKLNYNCATEKFIENQQIKPHQFFKTIHQISIAKVANTNLPLIFNVNGRRDEKWKNHVSCQLKNHPFYFEVDQDRTLEQQIKYNEIMNKKMLEVYGSIDAYLCGGEAIKELVPLGQYTLNFVYNNENDIIFRPDLRKETQLDVDFPLNVYFEVYYRKNEFINVFYISKLNGISEDQILEMKKMLIEIYENLPNYWNKKIKEF